MVGTSVGNAVGKRLAMVCWLAAEKMGRLAPQLANSNFNLG
jgi:hypothetical protein